MRLALYQPEIAPNVGASIRISACFGAALDIIEPCGFPLKDREIKRAAMDYGALVAPQYFPSWNVYRTSKTRQDCRLVLLTTKTDSSIYDFSFDPSDTLLVGQESAGVPEHVRADCNAAVTIPLALGARSLNMSVAAAVALAEAKRQFTLHAEN